MTKQLAIITEGSTREGCIAKLDEDTNVEDVRVGKFVVIEGQKAKYFSLLTDVELGATNPEILLDPPPSGSFTSQVLSGISTFGKVWIKPMLMLRAGENLQPVKTVPSHFSPVLEATSKDFELVFGKEDKTHFELGRPLDMDIPVCLDLEKFTERSNGVFGKSGTGKSFLTRLLLAGTIKNETSVNFIFDMHNEYGWETRTEEDGTLVKGLRQLFPGRVKTFSIDPASSRARGVQVDHEVTIGLDEIEVADLMLLQDELGLSTAAIDTSYVLRDEFGSSWIQTLLDTEPIQIPGLAEKLGANEASLQALRRKLSGLTQYQFIVPQSDRSIINEMIKNLEHGTHIVLEFGRYTSVRAYVLVANIITRKIHELYVQKTEEFLRLKKPEHQPRQLMITIEEAHKFLHPGVVHQTIFGQIAREMRKYYVTLLVVDQRPSSIDPEILSQIGTRITALLNDEKDIDAVFTGVSGSQALRSTLATLDSKQQALILGHATPMPVVIRTREYGPALYKALGQMDKKSREKQTSRDIQELFG